MGQKLITFRVDEDVKKQFDAVCAELDTTPSQVFRQAMKQYIERYGMAAAQRDMLRAQKGKK